MLAIGQLIGDRRYEIVERIGSGGMADVYKAKCHKLNRFVAIKVLKEEFTHDKEFVNRFKEEAQSAACLSHPNIVGIFDVVEEKDIRFIVMEYVDGITLKQYITEKGHLSEEETLQISLQIAQGLSAAHERHIVHRDIKPQNILLGKDGVIKVADFGIARAVSGGTVNATAVGSVHYFSPEQARGSLCDERSDIYSLGISMFEMLTGHLPYVGETSVSVALAHINDKLPDIESYVSGISQDTQNIVKICTNKKPEQRYLSVYDLIAQLKKGIAAIAGTSADAMAGKDAYADLLVENTDTLTRPIPNLPDDEEENDEIETTVLDKVILGAGIAILVLILLAAIYLFGSIFDLFGKDKPTQGNTNGINFEETQSTAPTSESRLDTSMEDTSSVIVTTTGEEKVKMPDVVGKSLTEAISMLQEEGLRYEIAASLSEYSETIETGNICAQEYKKGKKIPVGTRVKIGLSLGSQRFEIKKEFIGMQKKVFEMRVANRDIHVSYIQQNDENTAEGQIISMQPSSGYLNAGDSLTVYVSNGPTTFKLVNVVKMTESQAKTAIKDAGMVVGTVKEEYSSTIAKGTVISQSPAAGQKVPKGTKVDLVISIGAKEIKMPDLVGKDYDDAEELLEKNDLEVGKVTKEYSSKYAANKVIKQSVKAKSDVKSGTKIDLVISKGPEKAGDTEVLLGMKEADAKKKLTSLGLEYGTTKTESSSSVAEGCVIRIEKASGSGSINKGDKINLIVSSGPASIDIPNVVGSSVEDAKNTLSAKGFKVVVEEIDSVEAAGTVLGQTPNSGSVTEPGGTVTISVSKGNMVTMPKLIGKTYEEAKQALAAAGLAEDQHVYSENSAASGTVLNQNQPEGAVIAKGTAVQLTISIGSAPETEAETPAPSDAGAEE